MIHPQGGRLIALAGSLVALAGLLAVMAACGSDDSEVNEISPGAIASVAQEDVVPIVVSSELTIGSNRFVLGLIQNNQEVLGAETSLRFYKVAGGQATLKAQAQARPVRITRTYTEVHPNGEAHTHEAGETGVYVANVDFDAPGEWQVEVNASRAGIPFRAQRVRFMVGERALTPVIGTKPPASRQTVLADVGNDAIKIDSSNPPVPDLHNLTIADALVSGKPTVIAFASPGFCVTRICGPAKQVLDELYPRYQGRANFIHVEPYQLQEARSGKGLIPAPVMAEWGLQTEPWIFVLDKQGNVIAKYEGIVALGEVEPVLQHALSG